MQSPVQQPNMLPEKIQQIKSMMEIVRTSSNPGQMLNFMAQSNPELKSMLEALGNNNPRDFFYAEARRKGLTDDQIDAFLKKLANASL